MLLIVKNFICHSDARFLIDSFEGKRIKKNIWFRRSLVLQMKMRGQDQSKLDEMK